MSGGKDSPDPRHSMDPLNQKKNVDGEEGGGGGGEIHAERAPEHKDIPGLQTYPLHLRDQVVPILSPTFSVKSDGDDTVSLFTLRSTESDSPPSSVHSGVSRKSLLSIHSGAEEMADPSASNPTTPRPPLQSLTEHLPARFKAPTVPTDIIHYIGTPECPYTHDEKAFIFKVILRTSILAYDSESGVSRFAWAHGELDRMDSNAKAMVLMHSEHTIASLCQAFLSAFEAAKPHLLPPVLTAPAPPAAPATPAIPRSLEDVPQIARGFRLLQRDAFQSKVIRDVEEKQRIRREGGASQTTDVKGSMERMNLLKDRLGRLKSSDSQLYSSLMQGSSGSRTDQGQKGGNSGNGGKGGSSGSGGKGGSSGKGVLKPPSLFEPSSNTEDTNVYVVSLQRQLENKDREIANKAAEIERMKKKMLLFQQHEIDLKKKTQENVNFTKEVALLEENVKKQEKRINDLQQYVDSADELSRSKEEAADLKFKILEELILQLRGNVDELERIDADKTVEIQMLEYDSKGLREQAEESKIEVSAIKLEMELLRLALSGDVDAMKAIKLIVILDQIKLDLCEILGIRNNYPRQFPTPVECYTFEQGYTNFQASMDIWCRASLVIEKHNNLPAHYIGYKEMFSIENFYKSFDLIFGNTSAIRFVRNQFAHALPKKEEDIPELIRTGCPGYQNEIMAVCILACDTFKPLKDRVVEQEDEEDESFMAMNAGKKDIDMERWDKLSEWMKDTKKMQASIAVQAVAAAAAKAKAASGGGTGRGQK